MESRATVRRRAVLLTSALGLVVLTTAVGLSCAFKNSGNGTAGRKKTEKEGVPAAPVEVTGVRQGLISTFLETSATLEARNSTVIGGLAAATVLTLILVPCLYTLHEDRAGLVGRVRRLGPRRA